MTSASTPDKVAQLLLALIGTVALLIVAPIWSGYILSILWGWFIVPLFHLPVLTIGGAIGLMFVVNFLKSRPSTTKSEDKPLGEAVFALFNAVITAPLVALIIGAIIHHFIS